eukprot:COSAG04_NODE_454_length_14092_cov_330.378261_15_plen_109_part_00
MIRHSFASGKREGSFLRARTEGFKPVLEMCFDGSCSLRQEAEAPSAADIVATFRSRRRYARGPEAAADSGQEGSADLPEGVPSRDGQQQQEEEEEQTIPQVRKQNCRI